MNFEDRLWLKLDDLEKKVDTLTDRVADVDKRMAVADAKHGFLGGLSGAIMALAAYFLAPRH